MPVELVTAGASLILCNEINVYRATHDTMELVSHLGIICIVLYIINDLLKDRLLLKSKKLFILAVLDSVFLVSIVLVLLTNYTDLLDYWWLLIILGIPSLYHQYLRIKMKGELSSIKFLKPGITLIIMIFVWLKV